MHSDEGALCINDAKKMGEVCAGCGEQNPEYALEDNRLCFDVIDPKNTIGPKGIPQALNRSLLNVSYPRRILC